ncbi:hypothetical protein TNCV_635171 [Trichonephila clavipes]|nr:hypothetical protein TNCV_635171 [Trichonephila clavipes]
MGALAFTPYFTGNFMMWYEEVGSRVAKCGLIKGAPSLHGNLRFGVSRQTDHLTGTSAHAPQAPKSRILSWAQQALALMGCQVTELSYETMAHTRGERSPCPDPL